MIVLGIRDQLIAAFWFFVIGAASGLVWDAFRFAGLLFGAVPSAGRIRPNDQRPGRLVRVVRRIATFAGDLAFCAVVTVVYAVAAYALTDGKFRFYTLVSFAVGFWIYRVAPGRAVRIVFDYIAEAFRFAVFRFLRAATAPVRFTIRLVCRALFAAAAFCSRPARRLLSSAASGMRIRRAKKRMPQLVSPVSGDGVRR